MFCYIIPVIRSNPCICLSLQSTVRPLQPFPDWMHLQCLAQLGDWGWINAEKFLFIMTCAGCFHHSVYYFIVFFTPESPLNDGQGCRSIRWPHIRMSCRASWKSQSRLSLIFFFPLPRLQITLAPPRCLIPLGEHKKKRAATPAAAETSVSLSGCSVLACRPSHLECAGETIRCNRRVAACCRER